jgi:hypothetical protein
MAFPHKVITHGFAIRSARWTSSEAVRYIYKPEAGSAGEGNFLAVDMVCGEKQYQRRQWGESNVDPRAKR